MVGNFCNATKEAKQTNETECGDYVRMVEMGYRLDPEVSA